MVGDGSPQPPATDDKDLVFHKNTSKLYSTALTGAIRHRDEGSDISRLRDIS
jgi:hypothetical protein